MALAPVHWASFTVGGGTPLLLNIAQLEKLFFSVFDVLNVDWNIYKTIETSPTDTTAEKVALLTPFPLIASVLAYKVFMIASYIRCIAATMPPARTRRWNG